MKRLLLLLLVAFFMYYEFNKMFGYLSSNPPGYDRSFYDVMHSGDQGEEDDR